MITFLSSSSIIPAVSASFVVAILYLIFQSVFGKKEKPPMYDPSIPISLQTQLHINDKNGFVERIEYWIAEGNYKEALHLCTVYINHHGYDAEIDNLKTEIKKHY